MADPIEELRAARQELDAVIEEIRTVEGFEDFLAPPTFADVALAAQDTPLVYLAAATPGGIGLVVRGEDVGTIELETLTEPALRERVDAHLAAYTAYVEDREGRRDAWEHSLDELCAWLWEAAMEQVLRALGDAPAATIVAGGLLGLLPLHAAWTEDTSTPTGRRYAIDQLPLSYAPNARALSAARAVAASVDPRRALAVDEPWPVNAPRLRATRLEVEACCAAFPDEPVVLPGPRATARRFLKAAPDASVLHLACHGFAQLEQPLESGLLFANDERVTLRRLMGLQLRVRLAVLSACETLLPGTALPDEVVSLPTGLLQAGVGGVVASLWAVPDAPTALLMADFYRRWRVEDEPPAVALRGAQQWLRDSTNGEKADLYEQALDGSWLPAATLNGLAREVPFDDDDGRAFGAIRVWAAFAHVGA